MGDVLVIGGCRSPFVRAGQEFLTLSPVQLAARTVCTLLERLSLDPREVQELIFGQVLHAVRPWNLAREIIFQAGLPLETVGHTVSNNCITGLLAANTAAEGIRCGRIECAIAGGVESLSHAPFRVPSQAGGFFRRWHRAKSAPQRFKALLDLKLRYLIPEPFTLKESATGLSMGEHCELMAEAWAISRQDQDALAMRSHHSAAAAAAGGFFSGQIAPIEEVAADTTIRPDTALAKLSGLPPVFKSGTGTITAGNSSLLTDGAAALCICSPEKADALKTEPLGKIVAAEFAALDPELGLLMGPAITVPRLLKRVGLSADSIDVFEIHEAFAAQVLANLRVWEEGWQAFPELEPIGPIPREKINPNGGSIALGHPFGATGARLILSALHHLRRTGGRYAVVTACAAGGMGAAMLLRRD